MSSHPQHPAHSCIVYGCSNEGTLPRQNQDGTGRAFVVYVCAFHRAYYACSCDRSYDPPSWDYECPVHGEHAAVAGGGEANT